MKERPIVLSGEEVRAILDGTKTQIRRVVGVEHKLSHASCPLGVAGDRLWVRETWADVNTESGPSLLYKAGGYHFCVNDAYPVEYDRYPDCQFTMWCGDLLRGAAGHSWRSPVHMPRWASRITLEITGVRVERLQDISAEDATAEGVSRDDHQCPCEQCFQTSAMCAATADGCVMEFAERWDASNSKRSTWVTNPWVWVIEFKRPQ